MGIIIPKTEKEMAAERAREEAEMMWCNPEASEKDRVEHDKEKSGIISDFYPGLHHWVCSLCGFRGYDRVY